MATNEPGALPAKELSLGEVFLDLPDSFFIMDSELRYSFWNRASAILTGIPEEAALGRTVTEVFPEVTADVLERYRRVLRTGEAATFEAEYELQGSQFVFEITAYPVGTGLAVLGRDITGRREAEAALRRSESRLADAEHIAGFGSWEWDRERNTLSVSRGLLKIFGPSCVTYGGFMECVLPADRVGVERAVELAWIIRAVREIECRVIPPGDAELWVRLRLRAMFDDTGGPLRLVGTAVDITEHRLFAGLALRAATEERRRVGRELHDRVGQHLTGLAMMCRNLGRRLSGAEASAAGEIEQLANETVGIARSLASGLDPTAVEQFGLAQALRELAAEHAPAFGLHCVVEASDETFSIDPLVAMQLHFIAREAFFNCAAHAEAKNVLIGLADEDAGLVLTIADDGVGPRPGRFAEGHGLEIMRYRAKLIRARLVVEPRPEGGTVVRCLLPAFERGSEGAGPMAAR